MIEAVYSLFKVFGWEVQHPGMEDLWRQRVSHSLSFAIKTHIGCEKAKLMRTKPNAPFGSQKAGSWARALKCQSLRLKFATHWSQRSNYSTGNIQTVATFPNIGKWMNLRALSTNKMLALGGQNSLKQQIDSNWSVSKMREMCIDISKSQQLLIDLSKSSNANFSIIHWLPMVGCSGSWIWTIDEQYS